LWTGDGGDRGGAGGVLCCRAGGTSVQGWGRWGWWWERVAMDEKRNNHG